MKRLWRTMLRRVTPGPKLAPPPQPPEEVVHAPRGDYGQETYFSREQALQRAVELRSGQGGSRRRIYVVGLGGRWVINIEPKRPRGVAQRYQ